MAAMSATWVIKLAAFSTLAATVARAAKSPYDTCTCPINETHSYPLGQIQFLCPGPLHNVSTPFAPISSRPLFNNQTDLCKGNHCCEYKIGGKPQLKWESTIASGETPLLVFTYVLMAVCSTAGILLYMVQPYPLRHSEHADVRRRLLTLVASLLGAVGFSIGSDLLLYSTAIHQEAYGDGWAQSLSPILDLALAVDVSAAVLGLAFISIWLADWQHFLAQPAADHQINTVVQQELFDGMLRNLDQVRARLVKSLMAGILCALLILVTPEKILYDGSSGVVFKDFDIMDLASNTPLQTHDINVAKLKEINVLVDVLLGLIMLPLFQSMLHNAAAAVNLIWTFTHVKAELARTMRTTPHASCLVRFLRYLRCDRSSSARPTSMNTRAQALHAHVRTDCAGAPMPESSSHPNDPSPRDMPAIDVKIVEAEQGLSHRIAANGN